MSHMSLTEAGLWNVETHRPLAYFTQKPRERSSVITAAAPRPGTTREQQPSLGFPEQSHEGQLLISLI